jgi:riboflavin kinase/FMN adenylyltransferase
MVYKVLNINDVDFNLNDNVATIGFFDGVHLGHQKLIKMLDDIKGDMETTVITFESHFNKRSLTLFEDKIDLLNGYGVDNIIIIANSFLNFNSSRDEFVSFLKSLNINKIVCGDDFRYGSSALGDVAHLKLSFDVDVVSYETDSFGKISSSDIRGCLDDGLIKEANAKLSREHFITGVVVRGDQIGREIDFPTANINTDAYLPNDGVYVTKTIINGKIYLSLTNIGTRPTVNGHSLRVETHILDFSEDIYGVNIKVLFVDKIRNEVKFSSLEELKKQIIKDVESTRKFYGN